ncbi:SRPBCC family protein [Kribbella sp. NPDC051952]|uniref:SRPBCC family protein n=1 Tax=Kribbella sp. NPDC051952 TaxID=3154851 RepID=UPI00343F8A34
MTTIERVIVVDRPVQAVFAYLSDFENTNEWDPGTVKTTKIDGNGGVGTRYHNTSSFAGRESDLEYTVEAFEPGRLFQLRGENKSLVSHDIMRFRDTGGGTEVTYRAIFHFRGLARLAVPLLKGQFKKLGDNAEQGMRKALFKL